MKQCDGYPQGHECPVLVADDRMWCRACREKRQEAEAAGLLRSRMTPIAVVLKDFADPTPMCVCGGDATAPHHECSLLHAKFALAERTKGALQIPRSQVSSRGWAERKAREG